MQSHKQLKAQVIRLKRLEREGYQIEASGRLVHRRVCREAWGPYPYNWVVHHIDENKQNNHPDNLIAMPRDMHSHIHKIMRKNKIHLTRKNVESVLKGWGAARKDRDPEVFFNIVKVSPLNKEVIGSVEDLVTHLCESGLELQATGTMKKIDDVLQNLLKYKTQADRVATPVEITPVKNPT